MALFKDAISTVLKHEGGFVDHPADPGGATNFGVSLRFLTSLPKTIADLNKDGKVDRTDIKNMTVAQASMLYESQWWNKYSYGTINDQALATKLFDTAVNLGASQAHKLMQRALVSLGVSVVVDGVLGPKSIAAINACNAVKLLQALRAEQAAFYMRLIKQKPSFKVFEKGWMARAAS